MATIHVKGKSTKQAHVALPEGTFEEEHGRQGFFGKAAHLYHTHAPTGWTRIEGPLRPHAFDLNTIEPPDMNDPDGWVTPILGNHDVMMCLSRRSAPMPFIARNGDGDEVWFVHRGEGMINTDWGTLSFEKGDYIVIPRGAMYQVVPVTSDNFFLVFEANSEANPPSKEVKGLLGQHALYDESVIVSPEPVSLPSEAGKEYEVRVRRLGQSTKVFYPFNPFDVVGWKGDLYPWKVNMRDIRPVISPRYHLPPSAHTTLVMQNAVICSFLPRPLEEDPEALKVPFFHKNIDYDEVLFYHDGDFFSRDNIKPGMVTFHPIGIHHGPHPQALKSQASKTHTNEKAVMLDTRNALEIFPDAEAAEWKEYWASWKV
jgi:homogentisate 1,2-dioxygenase